MAKPAASSSFSNLFLLFFGSGTFALPWGFVHGGLLGGTLGVFAVAILTYLTISMLVVAKRCQQRRLSMLHADATKAAKTAEALQQSLSYASITTLAFGTPHAGLLVKAATTLSSLGACAGESSRSFRSRVLSFLLCSCCSPSHTFLLPLPLLRSRLSVPSQVT